MSANRYIYMPHTSFTDAVEGLVDLYGTRSLERRIGISKATISRVSRGREFDIATAQALGGLVSICPCCGRKWRSEP